VRSGMVTADEHRTHEADAGSGGAHESSEGRRPHPALLSLFGRPTVSQVPPPHDRLTLADTPNAVGLARLHTADVLSRWGVPSDSVETVKLLVSELATNAVRHPKEEEKHGPSYSECNMVQTFEVALEIIGDAIKVSVWDRDARPPVLKQVGVEATGGRGIFIVAAMSRRWGCYPAREMPGKVVWAEVPLVPATLGRKDVGSAHSSACPPKGGPREPRTPPVDPHVIGRVLVGVRGM